MDVAGKVGVGYVFGSPHYKFYEALINFFLRDVFTQHPKIGYWDEHGFRFPCAGLYAAENRNAVVERFLATDLEWLWMLDTDISFPPDCLDYLLAVADPIERPILSALYFIKLPELEDRWIPSWFPYPNQVWDPLITDGCLKEVGLVGMGCCLIHRSVLEAMLKEYADDPWHWFGHDILPGPNEGRPGRAGEDVTFCHRARALGFKIHGLGICVQHHKSVAVPAEFLTLEVEDQEPTLDDAVPELHPEQR